MTRVVLVHGAATDARVWDRVVPLLEDCEVFAPERPRTGELARELDWLRAQVEGAWVVGMSGGATLGLALAATGTPMAGAVLHEPAVGSLVPGLLAPMAAALAEGGTTAFARLLYGRSWEPAPGKVWMSDEVTLRELAMFGAFEPAAPHPDAGRVVTTLGSRSPSIRALAARALNEHFGIPVLDVADADHFVAQDAPHQFADVILRTIG